MNQTTLRNETLTGDPKKTLRQIMLEVVEEYSPKGPAYFQQGSVLNQVLTRAGNPRELEIQQAILDLWNGLFLSGQLGWGFNLDNPNPPHCHLTDKGRATLQQLSRDPSNPDGYLANLASRASVDAVALSYIDEALRTYNANCFKACAVMVGAASERLILGLRDEIVKRMTTNNKIASKRLTEWQIKPIRDEIAKYLDQEKANFAQPLKEKYSGYWASFCEQIRRVRNDAGHPESIDPVTSESVHAALLIFPELAVLIQELKTWATS